MCSKQASAVSLGMTSVNFHIITFQTHFVLRGLDTSVCASGFYVDSLGLFVFCFEL
jgi:hypothetical protein